MLADSAHPSQSLAPPTPSAWPRPWPSHADGVKPPRPQDVFEFRRIHHYHILPGPPRLLAWDDPSRTGDHTAASRLIAPLGLCLSQLSRVLDLGPAHYALGGALGIAWGFGLRQSIHSLVIGRRNLRKLAAQRAPLAAKLKAEGNTPHVEALHDRVRSLQRQTRYGLVLDVIGGLGSTALGIAYMMRGPLLGGALPGLTHAALPLLQCGVFPPLLAPIAVVAVERAGRAAYTRRRLARMNRYLDCVKHPDIPEVRRLFTGRQRELARYYALDALARAGAVAGASITIFVGPAGLLLLVPCMAGIVTSTCWTRRLVRVDDALPGKEALTLDSDGKFIDAIVQTHHGVATLHDLRKLRTSRYPPGWGTRFRPLMRVVRHLRHGPAADAVLSGHVLAAYDRGETQLRAAAAPKPQHVLTILDNARVRAAFAKAVMKDKPMRRALHNHGVTMVGKKWSIDTQQVAMHVREAQWDGDPAHVASRMYELAEETLLTKGKTEAWRRQRALLDGYDRFAQARRRKR